ncbi:MAG: valine--tRNA ligase [Candidatus Nealsonbacteria bacterium]|nr:valine--tRNA ligase [Candidatus Nealsonbacteria bacterium]
MEPAYDPNQTENKIYNLWEKSGFFNPDKLPGKRKKTFSITIPPPNVTGSLHMGHALNATCQDILIRQKRMQGFKTLWLPGIDHAGIATQNVVEKQLKKEGKTRFDLGREKLIERIWEWKEKYGDTILNQFKKLGCSCDWSRTRFTMDENYVRAVKVAFSNYLKKGWIYQGERVVNWCPRCQTSLSDLELEHKENKNGKLWYIKYPIKDSRDFITVATTRPETMLGDTAVAINPKDERYKNLVNKKIILPLVGKEISIIVDRLVDLKFGTGAVKVTPAHDLKDYEIGLRHKLEIIKVIDEKRKITTLAPQKYQGLSALEAREKIIEDLKQLNLIEKIEDYTVSVPQCYRCKTTIEFLPSKQWFLKMTELAKLAEEPIKNGKIKFHPKRWEKNYLNWLKNVRDWCISRQIWWGHKIPIEGTNDVLDTWFSSALWPFATLGWPEKTKDLKDYFPTQVLATAPDILYLWVVRMIFSGMEFMKKIPFENIYINPTVFAKTGERMSKSLGTGVDPMDLITKYGSDATRFGIIFQISDRQDIKFSEENILMAKKFCNKIWNASRFVLMQIKDLKFNIKDLESIKNSKKLTLADKKIIKQLNLTIKSTDEYLGKFQFGKTANKLYDFFWHDFCDIYIEKTKSQKEKINTQKVLIFVLLNSLKLLHPFLPFITEEIYQSLPIKNKKKLLIIESWPK